MILFALTALTAAVVFMFYLYLDLNARVEALTQYMRNLDDMFEKLAQRIEKMKEDDDLTNQL